MTLITHAQKYCVKCYALQCRLRRPTRLFYANLQVAARLHNIMKTAFLLLLCLIWSLVEVHSQTVPYVSFMGVNLPNHAYVDLTTVGENISDPGNTVRCHTDLNTCCTSSQGDHRGDWFFPDVNALANAGGGGDIYRSRGPQVVYLRRRNDATSPSGIYHCEIPTVAVNDNVDTIMGERVYVGLYLPNEGNHCIECGDNLCTVYIMIITCYYS